MAWKRRLGQLTVKIFDVDHPPPHVHILGPSISATIGIQSGELLQGRLPPRLLKEARRYVREYRDTLLEAWRQTVVAEGRTDSRRHGPGDGG